MQKPAKKHFTIKEYLDLEDSSEYKSEYYKGEIFALAGGSINHNQIVTNLISRLNQTYPAHKCRSFATDLKLWVKDVQLFTYPDLMIICDKPQFYPGRDDTILNPRVIIEIISKSTEAYDRGKKFQFYRSIPSFQEYILIDQYSVHIDQFYIDPQGKWSLKDYNDINDVLNFSKIDFEISLADVFDLVDFELVETSDVKRQK